MSSVPKNKISVKNTPRSRCRSSSSRRRRRPSMAASRRNRLHSLNCSPHTTIVTNGQVRSRVSDKLEALKNLIPTQNGDSLKVDQLFKETADYIVRLRTQVFVLQRLIEFYGSTSTTGSDDTTPAVL